MQNWARKRSEMVANHITDRGVRDPRVLEAMRTVPRERFVPAEVRHLAFADHPVSIGEGQTISQPYIVAIMAEAAFASQRTPRRVLEVGTGCGYGAAVLATLAQEVITIERLDTLAATARMTLGDVGIHNVTVLVADGTQGHAARAPYDAIVVTAAGPEVPSALVQQLAIGGRLVVPVGELNEQRLVVVTRTPDGTNNEDLGAVRFVPLIGEQGWPD